MSKEQGGDISQNQNFASNNALVVLNFQDDYFGKENSARSVRETLVSDVLPKIKDLAEAFRNAGSTVIYVNTQGADHLPDYTHIEADLPPYGVVLQKKYDSALNPGALHRLFGKTTQLHKELKARDIQTLYIAGAPAWSDVIKTAFDAVNARYDVWVIQDAIGNDRAADAECKTDYVITNMRREKVPLIEAAQVHEILRNSGSDMDSSDNKPELAP